jgi:hypothetical protein
MFRQIKFYGNVVKGKPGEDRHNEVVTRTGWYQDSKKKNITDMVIPKARLTELLTLLEGEQYSNAEGITYYKPRVCLEIKTQAKPEEKPAVQFIAMTNNYLAKDIHEICEHFEGAFIEFENFRGFLNVEGARGALKTKYFKEIGLDKEKKNDNKGKLENK